jgi:hypothetical protein
MVLFIPQTLVYYDFAIMQECAVNLLPRSGRAGENCRKKAKEQNEKGTA